jgi:hypothetical protein
VELTKEFVGKTEDECIEIMVRQVRERGLDPDNIVGKGKLLFSSKYNEHYKINDGGGLNDLLKKGYYPTILPEFQKYQIKEIDLHKIRKAGVYQLYNGNYCELAASRFSSYGYPFPPTVFNKPTFFVAAYSQHSVMCIGQTFNKDFINLLEKLHGDNNYEYFGARDLCNLYEDKNVLPPLGVLPTKL